MDLQACKSCRSPGREVPCHEFIEKPAMLNRSLIVSYGAATQQTLWHNKEQKNDFSKFCLFTGDDPSAGRGRKEPYLTASTECCIFVRCKHRTDQGLKRMLHYSDFFIDRLGHFAEPILPSAYPTSNTFVKNKSGFTIVNHKNCYVHETAKDY